MENNKYYIMTLGCQMNTLDSERIETIMNKIGYIKTLEESEANVLFVNSCSVRQSAVDRIHGRVRKWNKWKQTKGLVTILTGCVLDDDVSKFEESFDYIIKKTEIMHIPELLNKKTNLEVEDYLDIRPDFNSKFQAYISIMEGCNNFCTYCVVPYTRGRERSRDVKEILEEIKDLVEKGYKEITLLGQNVNSYKGKDDNKESSFPELLQKISNISGDFWIRFFTSHPYDMSDELINVMAKNKKVCNHINLPVQSGNNEILHKMNRHYTVEEYKEKIEKLRNRIPDIAFSTDVIIGFCSETREQFLDTVDLFKTVKYDMAYLNKYSNRHGTVASKNFVDDVTIKEKKDREKELNKVLEETALENNKKLLNKKYKVLVEKSVEQANGKYVNDARTEHFKAVRFESNKSLEGTFVEVEIKEVTSFSVKGIIV